MICLNNMSNSPLKLSCWNTTTFSEYSNYLSCTFGKKYIFFLYKMTYVPTLQRPHRPAQPPVQWDQIQHEAIQRATTTDEIWFFTKFTFEASVQVCVCVCECACVRWHCRGASLAMQLSSALSERRKRGAAPLHRINLLLHTRTHACLCCSHQRQELM